MEDITNSEEVHKLKVAAIFYHKDALALYKPEWIAKCIESIKAQTYTNFEVHELDFGNDGQLFPGSVFYQKPFDNYVGAMNDMFDMLFGNGVDVVFNTNIDDYYAPERFEKQMAAIGEGFQLVSSNYIAISADGTNRIEVVCAGDIEEDLKNNKNPIAHPCVAMHKSFWQDGLKYIDNDEWEDLNLWQRAFKAGKKFKVLDDFLLYYRVHLNQVTKRAPKLISSFNEEKVVPVVVTEAELYQKPDTTSRGILLFATGNAYYGDCALRLAAALKHNEPGIKITLVADAVAMLGDLNRYVKLFDHIITPEHRYLHQKGKRMDIRAKIFASEISPYYETLMLDVDMMWMSGKKPSDYFATVKDVDFFIQNTGFADLSKADVDSQVYYYWAKISEVKRDYEFTEGKFYQYTGEWLYFKKTDAVNKWFKAVQDVYDNCKVKNVVGFANQTCNDELAYSIASVITGLYPNKDNYLPVYWPNRNAEFKKLLGRWQEIQKRFYAFSTGGNQTSPVVKEEYQRLSKAYFSKLSITANPVLRDKKSMLPERHKL